MRENTWWVRWPTFLICAAVFGALIARLDSVSAQASIPNGVFVRESNGAIWAVLDGNRVGVPIWQASDADIGALPTVDRWIVMNDGGSLVAGDRPSWLPASAPMAATGATPPPLVGTSPSGVTAELLGFTTVQHNWWTYVAGVAIKNGTAQPRADIKVRLDAFENGIQVGSVTETVPPVPAGSVLQLVYGRNADAIPGEVRVAVISQGRSVSTAPSPISVDSTTIVRTSSQPVRGAFRYEATVTATLDRDVAKEDVSVNVVLRDAEGRVVGLWQSGASSLPDQAAAGTRFKVTLPVYCVGEAATAEATINSRK